jgi:hypothetical protein
MCKSSPSANAALPQASDHNHDLSPRTTPSVASAFKHKTTGPTRFLYPPDLMAQSQCDRSGPRQSRQRPSTPHFSNATPLQAPCLLTIDDWEHPESSIATDRQRPSYILEITPLQRPLPLQPTSGLYKQRHIETFQHRQVALNIGLTPLLKRRRRTA